MLLLEIAARLKFTVAVKKETIAVKWFFVRIIMTDAIGYSHKISTHLLLASNLVPCGHLPAQSSAKGVYLTCSHAPYPSHFVQHQRSFWELLVELKSCMLVNTSSFVTNLYY